MKLSRVLKVKKEETIDSSFLELYRDDLCRMLHSEEGADKEELCNVLLSLISELNKLKTPSLEYRLNSTYSLKSIDGSFELVKS